ARERAIVDIGLRANAGGYVGRGKPIKLMVRYEVPRDGGILGLSTAQGAQSVTKLSNYAGGPSQRDRGRHGTICANGKNRVDFKGSFQQPNSCFQLCGAAELIDSRFNAGKLVAVVVPSDDPCADLLGPENVFFRFFVVVNGVEKDH